MTFQTNLKQTTLSGQRTTTMKLPNSNQTNVAIRIFKEQFDIIKNLPEQDRALVLYATVLNAFIQFENQTDYQNENQNDNQIDNQDYLYLNHISESISGISNNILVMFNKTIRAREFSDNYGGRRKNAGRKNKNPQANLSDNLSVSAKPADLDTIQQTSAYKFLNKWGGVGSAFKDEVEIDDNFSIFTLDHPQTKQMIDLYGDGLAYQIEKWLKRKYAGKRVEKRFIIEQFANFNERRK